MTFVSNWDLTIIIGMALIWWPFTSTSDHRHKAERIPGSFFDLVDDEGDQGNVGEVMQYDTEGDAIMALPDMHHHRLNHQSENSAV